MKVFRMYESSINDRYIDEIVQMLRDGGVVVYPTDSYYAIGCDALNNRAVERVCRIKDINPERQRLSMVCAGISQASEYARIDNEAFRILKANLPGPFTFVLPASPRLAKAFKGRKEAGARLRRPPRAEGHIPLQSHGFRQRQRGKDRYRVATAGCYRPINRVGSDILRKLCNFAE